MNSQPKNALHVFFRESLAAKQQIAAATKILAERQVKREDIPGLVIGLVQNLTGQCGCCDTLTVSSIKDPQQRQAAEQLGFSDVSLQDLCRAIGGHASAATTAPAASPPTTTPSGRGTGRNPS
jgi:hypothetical protein